MRTLLLEDRSVWEKDSEEGQSVPSHRHHLLREASLHPTAGQKERSSAWMYGRVPALQFFLKPFPLKEISCSTNLKLQQLGQFHVDSFSTATSFHQLLIIAPESVMFLINSAEVYELINW